MQKDSIKKLYILQVREGGISSLTFGTLNENEKSMLYEKEGRYYLNKDFRNQIRVVMTGGGFDIIHIGHIHTLKDAKAHGDVLIVSIARDDLIMKNKGRLINSQEVRAQIVEALKPVDLALVGVDDPKTTFEKVKPQVIVYGYDQNPFLKPDGVEIVKLEKFIFPEKFKTSKMIEQMGL
ncbi:MAG: adenylyltransferase/cytidyltransferase family protein [Candidatus Micrarchaeota archaeon]